MLKSSYFPPNNQNLVLSGFIFVKHIKTKLFIILICSSLAITEV